MQTNKVKYCAPFVHMIHSVDRLKVLRVIEKEARKNNRVISCLLQIHIAEEESKFGLDREEVLALLDSEAYEQMEHVRLCGLMGMSTFTQDTDRIRREFVYLRKLFDELKDRYFPQDDAFKELSMGMSGDYQIALEEGATILRIGSLIFGSRNYKEN